MAVSPKSVVGSHGMAATRFLLSAIECRGIRAAGIRIPVELRRVTDALTATKSPAKLGTPIIIALHFSFFRTQKVAGMGRQARLS